MNARRRNLINGPISRRAFLGLGAASAAGIGLFGGLPFFDAATTDLETVRRDIKIPLLPAEFRGFRIGFLTDSHLGRWIPNSLVERAAEALTAASVDLLVLGGDYLWIPDSFPGGMWPGARNTAFDGLPERKLAAGIYSALCDMLDGIPAPAGRVAVYGNHDLWVAPSACARVLAEHKFDLLVNRSIVLERGGSRLVVAGVDDYWTGVPRFPLEPKRAANEARVLVAHNPDYVAELLKRRKVDVDLALCGHTHGGQIHLPLVGAPVYNVRHVEHAVGLSTLHATQIYTSRGLGVVEIPYRLNCRPEVSIITLV